MNTERTDAELIGSFLNDDDERALRTLFERHLGALRVFLARLIGASGEADDLAQEALIRAWRNLKKFDREKNFRTWLFAIARNLAIDWLRKKRPASFSDFVDETGRDRLAETLEDDAALPDELAARAETAEKLQRALDELPVMYREAVIMHHASGLNFREMGEVSGESLNTVKSRYQRALVMLKKKLV